MDKDLIIHITEEYLKFLNDSIWILKLPDKKSIYINSNLEKIFERSLNELKENPEIIKELILDEDRDRFFKSEEILYRDGYSEVEYRISTCNSGVKWVSEKKKIIQNKATKHKQLEIILSDITRQKLIEESLRKNELDNKILFDDNPNPMWVIDKSTLQFLAVNGSAVLKFGYSLKEFLNMSVKDICNESEYDSFKKYLENNTNMETSNPVAWSYIKRDNTIIFVKILVHELSYAGVSSYLVLIIDVSERVKNESLIKELNKSLSDFRFAIDSVSILSITDINGYITYINDNFVKYSGYSRDELIGQPHKIINSGYHSKEFFKELWETVLSGKIWRGQVKNKTKNNSFFWVDTFIIPFKNENGEIHSFLAIRNDISEQKEKEEEIRKLNEFLKKQNEDLHKTSFLNSHKIRGPLTSILGAIHLLGETSDEEIKAKLLDGILSSAVNLDIAVNEIGELLNKEIGFTPFSKLVLDKLSLVYLIDDDDIQLFLNECLIVKSFPNIEIKSFLDSKTAFTALSEGVEPKPDIIFLDLNMPITDGWAFLDKLSENNINVNVFILTSSFDSSDIDKASKYRQVCGYITKPFTSEKFASILM